MYFLEFDVYLKKFVSKIRFVARRDNMFLLSLQRKLDEELS